MAKALLLDASRVGLLGGGRVGGCVGGCGLETFFVWCVEEGVEGVAVGGCCCASAMEGGGTSERRGETGCDEETGCVFEAEIETMDSCVLAMRIPYGMMPCKKRRDSAE